MAQVKCIEPTKMKNTALQLYKMTQRDQSNSTYLCWAVMSMLVEQAMNEPEMNDEDYFTPIAKNPPAAKNKLQKIVKLVQISVIFLDFFIFFQRFLYCLTSL